VADGFDLAHVETLDLVVPARPDEVAAWLREQVSGVPGRATFRGTVRDDRFELLRKVMGRRHMRPWLRGTLEPVPGGTRLQAGCELPSWSRWMGRGVFVYAAIIGLLWLGMGAAISGVPDDPLYLFGALFMALVWLPFTGVVISGSLVSQAVAERVTTPQTLRELLVARWPEVDEVAPEAEPVAEPQADAAVAPPRPVPRPQAE